VNRRCARKGHKWRQKITYVLGEDRCVRWGCDAERVNPGALPPWNPESSNFDPALREEMLRDTPSKD